MKVLDIYLKGGQVARVNLLDYTAISQNGALTGLEMTQPEASVGNRLSFVALDQVAMIVERSCEDEEPDHATSTHFIGDDL